MAVDSPFSLGLLPARVLTRIELLESCCSSVLLDLPLRHISSISIVESNLSPPAPRHGPRHKSSLVFPLIPLQVVIIIDHAHSVHQTMIVCL